MPARIAIDTGGTFTDIVLADPLSGAILYHKVPSTPDNPAAAILTGVTEILTRAGLSKEAVELLIHGTTVATNTVLQRAGARTAFVTTAGFRDVLQIQRQDRPELYNLRARRTPSLIPRALRFELEERILYDGDVAHAVDRSQLDRVIDGLAAAGVASVGIGLLHSHVNPDHERVAGEAIAQRLPHVAVCLSHELSQEEGEYERFSVCAMNAYVQPVMTRYLAGIEDELLSAGIRAPFFVMKSSGGVMAARDAGRQAVHTILSGPAGGVKAGHALATRLSRPNLITADMGGTSFDVGIITDGRIALARSAEIDRLAINAPMLDIHTVGAGGGSIAWIDSGGALHVGPRSAGAHPGPACYGRGGGQPTVTDANLVLGRLGPHSLLDGRLTLDVKAARDAIRQNVAEPLSMPVEQAAEGIVRLANTVMANAIRRITVARGLDPRRYALCPFGGAGPLHASEIADAMGIREIVVPAAPGVTSAAGLLSAGLREDRVKTLVMSLREADTAAIEAEYGNLEARALTALSVYTPDHEVHVYRRAGLRYAGQGYDLSVEIAEHGIDARMLENLFHSAHQQAYGFARRDHPVQLVHLWVSAEIPFGAAPQKEQAVSRGSGQPASRRPVYFSGTWRDTPVYRRETLAQDAILHGPAVIEQMDATTLLWPGQSARTDPSGCLIIDWMERES